MRKIPTGFLSLFIILLWGPTFPAITLAIHTVSPYTLAGWRVLPAGIVVSLWALLQKYPPSSRRLWGAASISAVFNVVMLYGGQIAASAYLSPGLVAGLIYLQPMLVALFAHLPHIGRWPCWRIFFFIMVGGTAGAWLLWLAWLSRGEASRVSTFLFGVPVVASLIGIFWFNETLSLRFVGGLVAVSCSILLVNARIGIHRRDNSSVPNLKSQNK